MILEKGCRDRPPDGAIRWGKQKCIWVDHDIPSLKSSARGAILRYKTALRWSSFSAACRVLPHASLSPFHSSVISSPIRTRVRFPVGLSSPNKSPCHLSERPIHTVFIPHLCLHLWLSTQSTGRPRPQHTEQSPIGSDIAAKNAAMR